MLARATNTSTAINQWCGASSSRAMSSGRSNFPSAVDEGTVAATLENGILRIVAPKGCSRPPRRSQAQSTSGPRRAVHTLDRDDR